MEFQRIGAQGPDLDHICISTRHAGRDPLRPRGYRQSRQGCQHIPGPRRQDRPFAPSGRMRAGMPTARHPAGTSHNTTALAPMDAWSPMLTGPSILAPASMSTCAPQRRGAAAGTQRHLLKQQAIGTDPAQRMDTDPVGMRQKKAAIDAAVHRNVGPGHHRPQAVLKRPPDASGPRPRPPAGPRRLPATD